MNITFETEDKLLLEIYPPKPVSQDLPDWYTKMPSLNTLSSKEIECHISNCMPADDFITSGYMIYQAYEHNIEAKVKDFVEGLEIETQSPRMPNRKQPVMYQRSSIGKDNKIPKGMFRIETEWRIKTPPGYSCIIIQPAYDFNDKITILPGIVDTDKHDYVLKVVGHLNKGVKEHRIMPGDKLVQVIPFKRESWKHEIKHVDRFDSKVLHYLYGAYEKLFHTRKSYK